MASKRGIEAGKAYVTGYFDNSRLVRGLKKASRTLSGFGKRLANIGGAAAFGGLTVGALGLNKILGRISEADQINKAAKAFGLATEAASGMFGVFSAQGATNARENVESLVTLAGRVSDAAAGKEGQSAKLFEGLNVSAKEIAKLPLDEQFYRIHAAILELDDPIERVNRLMLAFGEDGGKTLIGTLSRSTAELRSQAKAYELTADEAQAASEAQASANRASAAFSEAWLKIAVVAAPAIAVVADWMSRLAGVVADSTLAKAIVAGTAGFIAMAGAASLFGLGITGISFALGALLSPLGLGIAAFALVAGGLAYAAKQSGILGDVIDWLKEQFGPLAQRVMGAFQVLKDAIAASQWKAAGDAMMAGISAAWITGLNHLRGHWDSFRDFVVDAWDVMITSLRSAWSKFSAWYLATMGKAAAAAAEGLATVAALGGKEELASMLRLAGETLSIDANVAALQGRIRADEIERDRNDRMIARQDEREQDADRRQKENAEAVKDFADALAAAKVETESALAVEAPKPSETPGVQEGSGADNPVQTPRMGNARDAANMAAVVGSARAATALAKAMRPLNTLTPGEKAIAGKIDQTNAMLERINEGKIVVTETRGR